MRGKTAVLWLILPACNPRWTEDPWPANVRTRSDQVEFPVGVSF